MFVRSVSISQCKNGLITVKLWVVNKVCECDGVFD